MKATILHSIVLVVLTVAYSSCQQRKGEGLPYIDVKKKYPQKEIRLTDIADITYLCLNSNDSNYLYRGTIDDITANTIVTIDRNCGSIFFFSKDGTPKSHFNRKGQGPEEYNDVRFVVYDETADDVFVVEYAYVNTIRVYSSTGKYKRDLVLPRQGVDVGDMVSFDDQSLFFFDARREMKRMTINKENLSTHDYVAPFYRISKTNGAILDYFELPLAPIFTGLQSNNGVVIRGVINRLINCAEGVRLCNPETDTVFLYKQDQPLIPVMYQIPSVTSLNPMIYLNNYIDIGNYQCVEAVTVHARYTYSDFPREYYMRDKKTGQIFHPKLLLPDYKGKVLTFVPFTYNYKNKRLYFHLHLNELKQAYSDNRLSGKLKELVAILDENKDNDVFVMLNFK